MNPAHFANLLAKKNVICIAESSHFEPDTIGNFKLTIDKREISGPQLAIKSGPLRCLVPRHDRARDGNFHSVNVY
jgi:hypothetical protein